MESPDRRPTEDDASAAGDAAARAELDLLRDVLRLLPSGVTVQDEQGRVLLINELAAAQLGLSDPDMPAAPSAALNHRRETGIELLRAGRPHIVEETVQGPGGRQVLLTAHRPIRLAERDLLLSSSADISEQKAFEDQLFRSAYYDELTDLPT